MRRASDGDSLKIGIVGCGAVTELRHLPALARRSDCRVAALVDANRARAEELAGRFVVPRVAEDHLELRKLGLDAAIVAVPNRLHAAIAVPLLAAGLHVLVEKPMALSVGECDEMVQAATAGGAVLAVGLARRFMHSSRFVKWAVEAGVLGPIIEIDVRDGFVFGWPLTSESFFRRDEAGGGVLIDTGVHVLDQLLWWVGDVRSFEYYDDNYGGVEADCEVQLTFESGTRGVAEISRTRQLRNTAIIRGEKAELEVGLYRNSLVLHSRDGAVQLAGQGVPDPVDGAGAAQEHVDVIAAEHADWLEAIRAGRPPAVTGAEGRRSVALIEACYKERRALQLPWETSDGTAREEPDVARR